ncbi:MAG: 50S ribosomal protein L6 [Nanoarchaeota archaeon]
MANKVEEVIEVPEGINVTISDNEITAKKEKNNLTLKYRGILAEAKGNKINLNGIKNTKKDKRVVKTISAHIKNMFNGLIKPYEYKLQICAVHFPITVSVDKNKNVLVIKNFLGEKNERTAKILANVVVEVAKEIITISSSNKEAAGQTAANIEIATKIRNRDRRTFQDGIFITEKCGEQI